MNKKILALLAAAAITGVASTPASASVNLLSNGSFETGDLTGWQLTNPGGQFIEVADAFGNCIGGSLNVCFYTQNAAGQPRDVTLSQTITSTAGTLLNIASYFWIENNYSPDPVFSILFDNQVVYSHAGQTVEFQRAFASVISTGSDTITFEFNGQSPMLLDQASVAVPEPGSLWLLMSGVFACAGTLRRRAWR